MSLHIFTRLKKYQDRHRTSKIYGSHRAKFTVISNVTQPRVVNIKKRKE